MHYLPGVPTVSSFEMIDVAIDPRGVARLMLNRPEARLESASPVGPAFRSGQATAGGYAPDLARAFAEAGRAYIS